MKLKDQESRAIAVTVTLDRGLDSALVERAMIERVSRSELVRRLLRQALDSEAAKRRGPTTRA